jgi:hypothetical protein
MAIKPFLRVLLCLNNTFGAQKADRTLAERRAAEANDPLSMRTLTRRPRADRVTATDYAIPASGAEISLRLYRPRGNAALPVHVLMHGGSFWKGGVEIRHEINTSKINGRVTGFEPATPTSRRLEADVAIFPGMSVERVLLTEIAQQTRLMTSHRSQQNEILAGSRC